MKTLKTWNNKCKDGQSEDDTCWTDENEMAEKTESNESDWTVRDKMIINTET